MSFTDKVVVVTGGSSGIGAVTAVMFAKEGADVAIVGRNKLKLIEVAEKCGQVGKPALVIEADLSKEIDIIAIIEKAIEKFCKLDILVNNAGIFRHCALGDKHYQEIFNNVTNVNVRSVALLSHLAVPYLMKTKGNIVNVSSIMGSMQFSGYSAYTASKAAVIQFTKVAANELSKSGIRVNVVSPGPVHTHLFDDAGVDITCEYLKSLTAMNKISKPEEIGELIIYLASDKASSVTGSNFVIDCGAAIKE